MELKPLTILTDSPFCTVLIVPSGIETNSTAVYQMRKWVLIVPSGIETSLLLSYLVSGFSVLIVPSGIETVEKGGI